jgi:uncharacterized protein (DUF433 family)
MLRLSKEEEEGYSTMDYKQYISTDPEVLGGKPCIAGTRISVELILEQLSLGATIDYLLDQYPQLKQEQIYAVLAFASARIHDDYEQERVAS